MPAPKCCIIDTNVCGKCGWNMGRSVSRLNRSIDRRPVRGRRTDPSPQRHNRIPAAARSSISVLAYLGGLAAEDGEAHQAHEDRRPHAQLHRVQECLSAPHHRPRRVHRVRPGRGGRRLTWRRGHLFLVRGSERRRRCLCVALARFRRPPAVEPVGVDGASVDDERVFRRGGGVGAFGGMYAASTTTTQGGKARCC